MVTISMNEGPTNQRETYVYVSEMEMSLDTIPVISSIPMICKWESQFRDQARPISSLSKIAQDANASASMGS